MLLAEISINWCTTIPTRNEWKNLYLNHFTTGHNYSSIRNWYICQFISINFDLFCLKTSRAYTFAELTVTSRDSVLVTVIDCLLSFPSSRDKYNNKRGDRVTKIFQLMHPKWNKFDSRCACKCSPFFRDDFNDTLFNDPLSECLFVLSPIFGVIILIQFDINDFHTYDCRILRIMLNLLHFLLRFIFLTRQLKFIFGLFLHCYYRYLAIELYWIQFMGAQETVKHFRANLKFKLSFLFFFITIFALFLQRMMSFY